MKNVHKLTEGAILLSIFAVLLLITLYIPILGAVINLFLALPFIFFAAKNNRKSIVAFLIAALLISLIFGTILALPLTLAYGTCGLVIGDFIREKKSRGVAFIAGAMAFLLNLIVQYGVAVAFFKVNFIDQVISLSRESLHQSTEILGALGQKPNNDVIQQFDKGLDTIQSLTPSLLVMVSLLVVFLIQLVSFPIIKRFGIEITGWKPFKELTLPRSLLFYFLIAMLVSSFLKLETDSYFYLALTNVTFVLQLLMVLQGLSFIWYYSSYRGWPRTVPIIATVAMLFMPIFLYIVLILGIIDLGFDLRKRLLK